MHNTKVVAAVKKLSRQSAILSESPGNTHMYVGTEILLLSFIVAIFSAYQIGKCDPRSCLPVIRARTGHKFGVPSFLFLFSRLDWHIVCIAAMNIPGLAAMAWNPTPWNRNLANETLIYFRFLG